MIKLISTLVMVLILSIFPNPNQQEKTYSVKLTLNQYNILITGLSSSDLPAKTANLLIQDISQQVSEQIKNDSIPKKK